MTLNLFKRNGRWAQVCGRSQSSQGSPQPNSKRGCVSTDMWAWTCTHKRRSRDKGFHSHQPFSLYSTFCTSARRQSWERFTLISRELWDRSSSQGKKGERPPARKVRCLQSRGRAGEASLVRKAGVAGGRKTSCSYSLLFPCQLCSICWQEKCPPGFTSSCGFPGLPSLHGLIQHTRVGREEPSPGRGRRTLSLGSQNEKLPSHEPPSTLASNVSSRLQRSKLSTVYTVCSPSDLLVGNLISLLTCAQSSPNENSV